MTRNEYKMIAKVMREYSMYNAGFDIAVELALLFHKHDETFDKIEWLVACDIGTTQVH